jgi:hypothetical protein
MSFELYEDYKRKNWNINFIFQFILLLLTVLLLILVFFIDNEDSLILKILGTLVFGGFVFLLGIKVYSFFSKYESHRTALGHLEIAEKTINWNEEIISWSNIREISIEYSEINGVLDYSDISYQNNRSDGINRLLIKLNDDKIFSGWYKIENQEQKKELLNILSKAIHVNKLSYSIANALLKPANYQEHQELKEKINQGVNPQ